MMAEDKRQLARRALLGEEINNDTEREEALKKVAPQNLTTPTHHVQESSESPLFFDDTKEVILPPIETTSETETITPPPALEQPPVARRPSPIILKTLEGDAAHSLQHSKKSVVELKYNEQQAEQKYQASRKSHINYTKLFVLIGIILLVILGLVGGSFYFIKNNNMEVQIKPIAQGIVAANKITTLSLNETDILTLTAKINNEKNTETLTELRIVNTVTDAVLSGESFIKKYVPNAPTEFTQTLIGTTMLGTQNNNVFLLLKTNSFEFSFPALLSWETGMKKDLEPLFGSQNTGPFTDAVIANKNIRIATTIGDDGLMYGFLDNNTILFASNKELFKKVVNIYFSGKIVQ